MPKEALLREYHQKLERWNAGGFSVPDTTPIDTRTAIALRNEIRILTHNNPAAKYISLRMLEYLSEVGVASTQELVEQCETSRQSVYKRLNLFTKYCIIRRAGRGMYLATPRTEELLRRRVMFFGDMKDEQCRDAHAKMASHMRKIAKERNTK